MTYGWILRDWQFAPVDDPHAGNAPGDGTFIKNMSSNGDLVVGLYVNSAGANQGFLVNVGS